MILSADDTVIKFRKSKVKEDSVAVADFIENKCKNIHYSREDLLQLIKSGIRMAEPPLKFEVRGIDKASLIEWFNNRIVPNTVEITIDEYELALINSLNLIFQGNLARTDFGSSRQRDFGQFVTDYTRGYIGEIAAKNMFKHRFGQEVKLEQKDVGSAKAFVSKDITKINEDGKWREVKSKVSIKTSKLQAMWVDIPESQMRQSDILLFVKVGLTVNHFASFLKSTGALSKIMEIGKSKSILSESDVHDIMAKVPDLKAFPAYIPGFAYLKDFVNGTLIIKETRTKKVTVGGIGRYNPETCGEVQDLGKIKEKFLSAISSLRWSTDDWGKLSHSL